MVSISTVQSRSKDQRRPTKQQNIHPTSEKFGFDQLEKKQALSPTWQSTRRKTWENLSLDGATLTPIGSWGNIKLSLKRGEEGTFMALLYDASYYGCLHVNGEPAGCGQHSYYYLTLRYSLQVMTRTRCKILVEDWMRVRNRIIPTRISFYFAPLRTTLAEPPLLVLAPIPM